MCFLAPCLCFTSQGSGLSSFRVATLARQSLTRFEGIRKPPFVFSVRPFELPIVEHKGRKRDCAFLPSVATSEIFERFTERLLCSIANCLSSFRRVADFSPPYRFNCLLARSFHCQFPRFEIGVIVYLRQRHLGVLLEPRPSRANWQIRLCRV